VSITSLKIVTKLGQMWSTFWKLTHKKINCKIIQQTLASLYRSRRPSVGKRKLSHSDILHNIWCTLTYHNLQHRHSRSLNQFQITVWMSFLLYMKVFSDGVCVFFLSWCALWQRSFNILSLHLCYCFYGEFKFI